MLSQTSGEMEERSSTEVSILVRRFGAVERLGWYCRGHGGYIYLTLLRHYMKQLEISTLLLKEETMCRLIRSLQGSVLDNSPISFPSALITKRNAFYLHFHSPQTCLIPHNYGQIQARCTALLRC